MRIKFPCAVCVHREWFQTEVGGISTRCDINGPYGTMGSLECKDFEQKEPEILEKPKPKGLIKKAKSYFNLREG